MGGFTSAIGDAASGAVEAVGKKLATGIIGDATESLAAVEHTLNRTPQGQFWSKELYQKVYLPTKAAAAEGAYKEALARVTDPATGKMVKGAPPINVGEIHSNASKLARHAMHGPKDALGVTLAASIEKEHGSLAAQSFSNSVAFLLKDYKEPGAADTEGVTHIRKGQNTAPYSPFKMNVQNAGVDLGREGTSPSYTPPGVDKNILTRNERAITNYTYQALSPLLAINHVATTFNGLLGSDPGTFIKGMTQTLSQMMGVVADPWEGLNATGALADTHLRNVQEYNRAYAQGTTEWAQGSVAKILHNTFHSPGFAPLRDYQLLLGANVGKMNLEKAAMDLTKDPSSARLRWTIGEYGLSPDAVLEQNGQLSEDDLSKGVYAFVNKHYFLDNSLSRSRVLQSTSSGRILGLYHSYVSRQSKLMYRAMATDMLKGQGLGTTARNLAVGATLFPVMGEAIKLTMESIRGQDSYSDAKHDLADISGKHGAKKQLAVYAQMMGHIGGFGVFAHATRGAFTHSLVSDAAGPVINSVANLVQDTGSMALKDIHEHGHHMFKNSKPVLRDVIYDTPKLSLLAQVLTHRYLPKKGDHPKRSVESRLYHYMRHEDLSGQPLDESNQQ